MIDYLILGGGSAGCVLAARLSQDPDKQVCLVEAGRDISRQTMPPEIRSRYPGRAYLDVSNIWQRLTASMGQGADATRRYEQARILGGGSAINALMTNRGAPADYDEWQALGAEGWNWQACLPYFRKLENDTDFCAAQDQALHGRDGPVRIRRTPAQRLSPFVKAVMKVLGSRGLEHKADQNGAWEEGVFVGAIGVSEQGERIPTSVCYLTDEVRQRKNLTLLTQCVVDRVLIKAGRATGARIINGRGSVESLQAREVIVCAGAIHSPAVLLRSGIGPAHDLAALDIATVADRPGVGANLMEHPSIAVSALLNREGRTAFPEEHHEQAIVRFSSGLADTVPCDMHGAILSRSGWHSVGYRLGTLFFWVNKSYSRGSLRLTSSDPHDEPQVRFDMLGDRRDLERLKQAVRFGAQTLSAPALSRECSVVFPSSYSPRVARVAMPGRFNALQRGALSLLLDIAGPLRSALIHGLVTQGVTLKKLLADDQALTDFVRRNVGGTWHPSGTCRMGRADDPLAVTTGDGRVIGVEGLRVCDASLMPSIPCANTNVPTLMIAERIADLIKAEATVSPGVAEGAAHG
ncbi:GMC family oxidoreductase N-terminal domain-containing protein [Pseudomonas syringae]|nr:GMC family oxidoreductase N-terminal domain-containing protein [Pseudomonas syringae]MBD8577006.1 GMC family oxidoreductase N-terminal domain-containing protein [Pseudomonas syringae]MBD8788299.1 GMC family oxidoreductase N-terminal domain-containing protein [Pseudomonas syringae]MBD8799501.1 GMC family oxidoreductase N-terminal domain-containing protein [Pseudomonas syringae]MBD8814767.1 GMC family oxidoreductase N-terminal domain-containing protein [Pseudomonas syringae]